MSDANITAVRITEETTLGTTPATPRFETLRTKAVNMQSRPVTVVSEELVQDRNVTDLVRVGIETGGDLPMELSYKAIDTPARGSMMSDWLRTPVRDNDGTADSQITDVTTTVITVLTAAATEANSGTFAVGHLIYGSGFTNAGNNGLKRLSAATATALTSTGFTAEAAPPATARVKAVGFQGASGDIVATITSGNALTATTLVFTNLGLQVGMWVKIGGTAAGDQFTTTAACNGWARISAIAASRLDFDIVPTGWAADAGTGKTIQVFIGDAIRPGTTKRHYSVEVEYSDLAVPEWDYHAGCRFGTMAFSAAAKEIMQISFNLQGLTPTNVTTRFTGATTKAAPTGDVMNTSSNVGQLLENGAVVPGANYVLAYNVQIDNALRRQPGIGSIADVGIGMGRVQVTGSITTYYGSNAIRAKILAGTASSFTALMLDPTLQAGYRIDIPRLKYADGTPTVPGVDQDRNLEAQFQGLKHSTLGYAFQLQRFDYLPL